MAVVVGVGRERDHGVLPQLGHKMRDVDDARVPVLARAPQPWVAARPPVADDVLSRRLGGTDLCHVRARDQPHGVGRLEVAVGPRLPVHQLDDVAATDAGDRVLPVRHVGEVVAVVIHVVARGLDLPWICQRVCVVAVVGHR